MTFIQFFAIISFLFPLAYSPGPGNISFAAAGASGGFMSTLPASFGYHIATFFVAILIGFGLSEIVAKHPQILNLISISGSLYIIYLGCRFIFASFSKLELQAVKISFFDGVMILMLNPKGYLIMALLFSQFTPDDSQNRVEFIILITIVFTLNNFIAFCVWTLGGNLIAKLLHSKQSQKIMNVIFGTMLILVAIMLNF
ncbi:MAG: LysE family translocator [Rhizobiales bacterium]|nr:LysE family translocator [Hyphomicrobiales bacterium]